MALCFYLIFKDNYESVIVFELVVLASSASNRTGVSKPHCSLPKNLSDALSVLDVFIIFPVCISSHSLEVGSCTVVFFFIGFGSVSIQCFLTNLFRLLVPNLSPSLLWSLKEHHLELHRLE